MKKVEKVVEQVFFSLFPANFLRHSDRESRGNTRKPTAGSFFLVSWLYRVFGLRMVAGCWMEKAVEGERSYLLTFKNFLSLLNSGFPVILFHKLYTLFLILSALHSTLHMLKLSSGFKSCDLK